MTAAQDITPTALEARRDLLVIDVREPSERLPPFGFIPGSLSFPASELPARAAALRALIPEDTPLALCCLTGRRSAMQLESFSALGYSRLHNLKGGLLAWREAQLPLCGQHTLPPFDAPLSVEGFQQALVSCFVVAAVESDLDNATIDPSFDPRALISALVAEETEAGGLPQVALGRALDRAASEAWRRGHPLDRIAENIEHMQGLLGGVAT